MMNCKQSLCNPKREHPSTVWKTTLICYIVETHCWVDLLQKLAVFVFVSQILSVKLRKRLVKVRGDLRFTLWCTTPYRASIPVDGVAHEISWQKACWSLLLSCDPYFFYSVPFCQSHRMFPGKWDKNTNTCLFGTVIRLQETSRTLVKNSLIFKIYYTLFFAYDIIAWWITQITPISFFNVVLLKYTSPNYSNLYQYRSPLPLLLFDEQNSITESINSSYTCWLYARPVCQVTQSDQHQTKPEAFPCQTKTHQLSQY